MAAKLRPRVSLPRSGSSTAVVGQKPAADSFSNVLDGALKGCEKLATGISYTRTKRGLCVPVLRIHSG